MNISYHQFPKRYVRNKMYKSLQNKIEESHENFIVSEETDEVKIDRTKFFKGITTPL